jgi:hypothetical protein
MIDHHRGICGHPSICITPPANRVFHEPPDWKTMRLGVKESILTQTAGTYEQTGTLQEQSEAFACIACRKHAIILPCLAREKFFITP